MEWVETTGRTVEEAKKAALEQLGVAEADADLQVVSEPKLGLFGRLERRRGSGRRSPTALPALKRRETRPAATACHGL